MKKLVVALTLLFSLSAFSQSYYEEESKLNWLLDIEEAKTKSLETKMKDENFAFPDPDDPLAPPDRWEDGESSEKIVEDLVNGRWYSRTYHAHCRIGDKEMLCPIIIFLDKTHTDNKGRLTQEPVMCMLGIFNQKIRNNPRAWRPLGFVPNFKGVPKLSDSAKTKSEHHVVLSHILSDGFVTACKSVCRR